MKPATKPAAKTSLAPAAPIKKKKKPKGFGGVTGKLLKPNPIVIGPKGPQGPETGFTLTRIPGKTGALSLNFVNRNTNLAFNPKTGFVAQIYSDEEIEVEPSILTASNWPKNADKILLKYTAQNLKKGEEYEIQGEVAYTVCHKKTNICETRQSTVYLTVTP